MSCDAHEFKTYKGVELFQFPNSTAYFYTTRRMAIDADGAPNAYNPQDTGIDANANAGYPNGGWRNVIVADPSNPSKPFIQPSGEFKDFFISKTTLEDSTLPVTNFNRYVVFPRTRLNPKWRISLEQIQQESDELIACIGGWQRILECVR